MAEFNPQADMAERRKFYREVIKDPDFQALSDKDRHDVGRRILFPDFKEPSKILPKVAAGAERVLKGVAKAAPFPNLIRAFADPKSIPEEEKTLGTLIQPFPEVLTETFQRGVEGVRSTFGHNPAKLIEDTLGSLPFLPLRGIGNIKNLRLYGSRRISPRDVTLEQPAITGRVGQPPPPPAQRQLISPARGSAEAFDRALTAQENLAQSPAGQALLRRQLQAESGPPEGAITFRPQARPLASAQTGLPATRRGGRRQTIQAPVLPPVEPTELTAGVEAPAIEPEVIPPAITAEPTPTAIKPTMTAEDIALLGEEGEFSIKAVEARRAAARGEPPPPIEPETLTSKEVVTKIESQQDPQFFDKPKIEKEVEKGGETYVKVDVDPTKLDVPRETSVQPGISTPEGGAIVTDAKGKVLDGRHRTVDAKAEVAATQASIQQIEGALASAKGVSFPDKGDVAILEDKLALFKRTLEAAKEAQESIEAFVPEKSVPALGEPPPVPQFKTGDWVEYEDSSGNTQEGRVSGVFTDTPSDKVVAGAATVTYEIHDAAGNPLPSPKEGTIPRPLQDEPLGHPKTTLEGPVEEPPVDDPLAPVRSDFQRQLERTGIINKVDGTQLKIIPSEVHEGQFDVIETIAGKRGMVNDPARSMTMEGARKLAIQQAINPVPPEQEAASKPPRPFGIDDIGKTVVAKDGTGWPEGFSGPLSQTPTWRPEAGQWHVKLTGGPTVNAADFEIEAKISVDEAVRKRVLKPGSDSVFIDEQGRPVGGIGIDAHGTVLDEIAERAGIKVSEADPTGEGRLQIARDARLISRAAGEGTTTYKAPRSISPEAAIRAIIEAERQLPSTKVMMEHEGISKAPVDMTDTIKAGSQPPKDLPVPAGHPSLVSGTMDPHTGEVLSTHTRGQAKQGGNVPDNYMSQEELAGLNNESRIFFDYNPETGLPEFQNFGTALEYNRIDGVVVEDIDPNDPKFEFLRQRFLEQSPQKQAGLFEQGKQADADVREQVQNNIPIRAERLETGDKFFTSELGFLTVESVLPINPEFPNEVLVETDRGRRSFTRDQILTVTREGAANVPGQPLPDSPALDVRQPTAVGTGLPTQGQVEGPPGQQGAEGVVSGAGLEGEQGVVGGRGLRDRGTGGTGPTGTGVVRRPTQADAGPREGGSFPAAGEVGPTGGVVDPANLNHVLPRDLDFIPTGAKTRVGANIEAISLLKSLEVDNRNPSPEEKEVLAQYVGWGGLKEVFDEGKADYREHPPRRFQEEQIREAANWEKNWGKEYDAVKVALTPEERRSAAESILNAHFTSREVINAMWDAVGRLGFTGGKALEPAVGVGHFIGLQPEPSRGATKWRAVDTDNISSRIAAKLYPESQVETTGIETARISANSQDLVISNVPFLGIQDTPRGLDRRYPHMALHNYFFVRGLDLTKPGGMMVAITSSNTLDTPSARPARELMAERADLVAAIRLPNTAFKKAASTEVTTDILFFRKKDALSFDGERFLNTAEGKTHKGEPVVINEFFIQHPELMLGRMSIEGTMQRAGQNALLPSLDRTLPEQLAEAIQALPENIFGARSLATEEPLPESAPEGAKQGNLVVSGPRVMKVIEGGELQRLEWSGDRQKVTQAKVYIPMRDRAVELGALELSTEATDAQIETSRADLNKLYIAYVTRYGPINGRASAFLEGDAELGRALALEDPTTTVQEVQQGSRRVMQKSTVWNKSAILDRRINFPSPEPTHSDTLTDALQISLNFRGTVEPEFLAELVGEPLGSVKEQMERTGIAFENPKTGQWEPRNEYLSGHVKDKLEEAQGAAQDDPRFNAYVAELEKVQPPPVAIENIGFKLGSKWMPPEIIEGFLKAVLDVEATVSYRPVTQTFNIEPRFGSQTGDTNRTIFGIYDVPGHKLVEQSLNLKTPIMTSPKMDPVSGEMRPVKDAARTLEAEAKQIEIQDRFVAYVRTNPEHSKAIATLFNERFTRDIERKHEAPTWEHYPNASHEITLFPHQKTVSTRMIREPTMLAHAVGTGKTFIISTVAMELKRLGLARKSLIVTQNATTEQFARSFKKLYPNSKILTPTLAERKSKNRNTLMSRIATGDWDAIIIPRSFMDLLPDNPERVKAHIQVRINEIQQALIAAKKAGGRSIRAADLQKALKKAKDRLKELSERVQDTTLTFEQLGIDALFVDESHAYKKLEFDTQMSNVKGLDTKFNKRGLGMLMKLRWIQEQRGGRNVYFATGTPVSNTVAEMWNIIRYLRPDLLKKYQVESFDEFAGLFVRPRTDLEMTATGDFKMQTRLSRFTNKPALMEMWKATADVVLPEEIVLKNLPSIKGGAPRIVDVPKTPELTEFIEQLKGMLEQYAQMSGQEKRQNRHIHLLVHGLARKASIDMRMINPNLADQPGSKLNKAAEEMVRLYHESTPVRGTQMAFIDLHQNDPDNPRFDAYKELKRKLIKGGVLESEIIIMSDKITGPRREAVFDSMNEGAIRIAIGSRERMGVGVNAQERMIGIQQIDTPPRPMDLEQSNGRALRQRESNIIPEIEINYYGVTGTLDAAQYGLLAEKSRWISQLLKGNIPGFDFEDPFDEAILSFDAMMAELSGNPKARQKVGLETDVRRLEALKVGHSRQLREARTNLDTIAKISIPTVRKNLATAEDNAKEFAQAFPPNTDPVLSIAGKTIEGRAPVAGALDVYFKRKFEDIEKKARQENKLTAAGNVVETTEFSEVKLNGKDLMMKIELKAGGVRRFINAKGQMGQVDVESEATVEWHLAGVNLKAGRARTGEGVLHGLTAQLQAIERSPQEFQNYLEKLERDQRNLSNFVEQPFQQEAELKDKKTSLAAILTELKATGDSSVSQGAIEASQVTADTDQAKLAQDIEDALKE